MDEATVAKIGGKITSIRVEYSRKVSTGDYGSIGAGFAIEAQVAPDANIEDSGGALQALAEAFVNSQLGPLAKGLAEKASQPRLVEADEKTSPEPPQETREPVHEGMEYMEVDGITVEFSPKTGQKLAKAKGGKWKKFGVIAWPEVFSEINVDVSELEPGEHSNEILGVYTRAVVLMTQKDGKVVPQKIVHFVKP